MLSTTRLKTAFFFNMNAYTKLHGFHRTTLRNNNCVIVSTKFQHFFRVFIRMLKLVKVMHLLAGWGSDFTTNWLMVKICIFGQWFSSLSVSFMSWMSSVCSHMRCGSNKSYTILNRRQNLISVHDKSYLQYSTINTPHLRTIILLMEFYW